MSLRGDLCATVCDEAVRHAALLAGTNYLPVFTAVSIDHEHHTRRRDVGHVLVVARIMAPSGSSGYGVVVRRRRAETSEKITFRMSLRAIFRSTHPAAPIVLNPVVFERRD